MRRLFAGVVMLLTAAVPAASTSVSADALYDDGVYIITLRDDTSPSDMLDDLNIAPDTAAILDEHDSYFSAALTADQVVDIMNDSRVKDIRKETFARSTDVQTSGPFYQGAQYQIPWGLDRIDSRTGRDGKYTYSNTGAGVRVYVVDSGVNGDHPAFGSPSRVVDGWSYRANATTLNNYNSARGNSSCVYDLTFNKEDPALFDKPTLPIAADKGRTDNDGHGTHVAGTVAGTLTGVAQGATIVPVRVLDSCGVGTETMINAGLKWIYDQHVPGTGAFSNTPAVVNLSLGFEGVSSETEIEIQKLIGLGIAVIAAAGNSGKSSCNTTPAGTPGTFSVGAMTSTNVEASYSNYGLCVDLFAPGSGVLSTWPYYKPVSAPSPLENTYVAISGTSMAAPHVAGAVARFLQGKSVSPTLPTEAWEWVKFNATCDAVSYSSMRTVQTPNRLLAVEAPVAPPCALKNVVPATRNRSLEVTWAEPVSSNSSAITSYTATASPGNQMCVTQTLTCTITGLANKVTYNVTVSVTNALGMQTSSTSVLGTPDGAPNSVADITLAATRTALDISWRTPTGEAPDTTYVVVAEPGGSSCTTTSTVCTLKDLVNGVVHTVTITGRNSAGESVVGTAEIKPDGRPALPSRLKTKAVNAGVKLSWPAVINTVNTTYVVTASPGGRKCTTKKTSCTISKLENGLNYKFSMTTKSPTGKISASKLVQRARPGFTVKKSTVALRSRTSLEALVTTISDGRKRWSETGRCFISDGRLVAPRVKSTCVLTMRVARTSKYPAMSTRLTVVVK